jgi:antitoxin component HigA of HigAB toxin-antitoxin module
MPSTTYEHLLTETLPEVIEDDAHYEAIGDRLSELVRKGARRTASETKLMKLLALLVRDYDSRNSLPPDDSTPGERLRFLLEHSGKTARDLLSIFGQRSHANEALNGTRKISAEQARKLGKLFRVNPGLFI